MRSQVITGGPFTGRHMLIVIVAFFAVVIGVNVTMAVLASTSWSGLVVENTYVASQEFNGKAAAMRAMASSGISGDLLLRRDVIQYDIHNRDGSPAVVDDVTLTFRRPVGDREDFALALTKTSEGHFEAKHRIEGGDWIVETVSRRDGVTVMHEARRIDTAEFGQ
ncbi:MULTISPECIES: FixH family protein [Rhizobium]|uniref:Cation transporter n=3 Tax=Rhizobium TaxID=379 RepID=A0A6P1C9X7_RHITR|nr:MULTISPECIES: FixH family protein [Rhizobium]AGB73508.1 nitrogen fixation protein FixH [Rhizobium tropici CIAT 899]AYG70435.1 cation transporter [Rhizobium sp. CCGE531]AYG76940.1 cation transporter [Rhizobium sp. CCGE532]ENN84767.1 nitrogen fixation protein FixH [Rhizobium freirei PRF 81]MBB4244886.1 nitrogen fixation protein FixH [Rhizobium tropici]